MCSNASLALADDLVSKEVIYLQKSENGVGMYTIQENTGLFKGNDTIPAQQDSVYDDVYRAIDENGEEITVLAATDTLFQSVDEVAVTENNVEEVINSYNLHEVLANDLRKAVNSEDHPTITTFLPKNISTFGISPGGTTNYTYNGYQMQRTLWGVTPLANGRPLELATGAAAVAEQKKEIRILFRNIVGTVVFPVGVANLVLDEIDHAFIFHQSAGDRIDMYLLENKTRTYVLINEGAYIPRLKFDTATWRYKINEITNDRSEITYSPYYKSDKLMSTSEMNAKAVQYYGKQYGETMYIDTIPGYVVSGSKTLTFDSELND